MPKRTTVSSAAELAALLNDLFLAFSDIGIVVLDGEGQIVYFSRGAERLYGYDAAEVLSLPAQFLLEAPLEEDSEQVEYMLLDAEERGQLEFEIPQKRKDGEIFPARVSFHPRVSAHQDLEGSIVIVQKLDAIESIRKLRTDFLTVVSHELRTPLSSIKGAVAMIKDGTLGDLSEEQKPFIDIVDRNSQRLLNMINCLLDVSRIDGGELTLELQPVALEDILKSAFAKVSEEREIKRIHLRADYPPESVMVMADPGRLEQAAFAVLDNAFKFNDDAGRVAVRLTRKAEEAVVEVEDTGPGMDPRYHSKIFEKFFQISPSDTRTSGGMGLGLYLAQKILAMHGGRIWVESQPGVGSIFRFTVPLAESSRSAKNGE